MKLIQLEGESFWFKLRYRAGLAWIAFLFWIGVCYFTQSLILGVLALVVGIGAVISL